MKSKESKEKRIWECCPGRDTEFKDFQDMAKEMGTCCPMQGDSGNCSNMMKEMMEMCCGINKKNAEDL